MQSNIKYVRLLLTLLFILNLGLFGFVSLGSTQAQTITYKVLFDNTHAETAGNADWVISTSQPNPLLQNGNPTSEGQWTGGISAWGVALQRTGRYSLATLPSSGRITYGDGSNTQDLTKYKVFVIPEPNTRFTATEKTAIMTFVQNGGGLFMVSDHDKSDRNSDGIDSVGVFNDLLNANTVNSNNPFGFKFDVSNISTDNPRGIPASAANHPVINGPFGRTTGTIIRSGTTMTLSPSSNPNAKGMIYRTSYSTTGNTGVAFAVSNFGQGRVAGWGDSSPMDDGTGQSGNNLYDGWKDSAATNDILALNATEWLASGTGGTTPTPTPTNPPGATATPVPPTATPVPPTATPSGGGSQQLIVNGGFETSSAWVESSSGGYAIVDTSKPRTGSRGAYMCDYNNCTDNLYQTITIPANATSATLSYYTYITTAETSHSYDFLNVQVRNTSNTVLATVKQHSDGNTLNTWQQTTYDLTSFKGQTVRIYFAAMNGNLNATAFYVDDVSVVSQ